MHCSDKPSRTEVKYPSFQSGLSFSWPITIPKRSLQGFLTAGTLSLRRRAVSKPFIPGILTSRRTRSGSSSTAFCRVSFESEASPQTCKSSSPDKSRAMPRRASGLSSAMRTLLVWTVYSESLKQLLATDHSYSGGLVMQFSGAEWSRKRGCPRFLTRYSSFLRIGAGVPAFL